MVSEPATCSTPAAGPGRRSGGLCTIVTGTASSGAPVTLDRCNAANGRAPPAGTEAPRAPSAAGLVTPSPVPALGRFSLFFCLFSSALLRFRCRAVIRVRSVMRRHLEQAHLRKGQNLVWPFCGTATPWCRHRLHFGCRGSSAVAPGSFSLDKDMMNCQLPV